MEREKRKSYRKTASLPGIDGGVLKLIAIVTMLIDHIGAAVVEKLIVGVRSGAVILGAQPMEALTDLDRILRLTGRISFPIFAFLLVEGFLHTKDYKKYASRLFLFALLSEIPFDLAFNNAWLEFGGQNIYFTLCLGLYAMAGWERYGQTQWWKGMGIAGICCLAAVGLRTDYDAYGVLFILLLYLLHNNPGVQTVCGCAYLFTEAVTAPIAFIPIRMYNGKRGLKLKYVFYLFYPLHLLVLAGVRMWIFAKIG